MSGLALLSAIWIAGIAGYFYLTNERQRENYLLAGWILLLLPALYFLAILLT